MSFASEYQKQQGLLRIQYPVSSSCAILIPRIKELDIKYEDARKQALAKSSENLDAYASALDWIRKDAKSLYSMNNCKNLDEKTKFEQTKELIVKEAKKYEDIVNAQTAEQKKTILFIGTSIMIVGLFLILRK